MSEFNFKSAICTSREQSERLLALGLKKDTADMSIGHTGLLYPYLHSDEEDRNFIPAWSLHRLIEMVQGVCSRITMFDSWVRIENRCMPYVDYPCDSFDNIYDNLIDCIEWLIKDGYFNKEYLVNQAEIEEHCKGVLEYLDYIRGEEE